MPGPDTPTVGGLVSNFSPETPASEPLRSTLASTAFFPYGTSLSAPPAHEKQFPPILFFLEGKSISADVASK